MTTIKSADSTNLEPVNVSLRSIKLIRSNVKELFKLLADGNQTVYDPTKDEENSNNFLADLNDLMNDINQRVRELETSALLTSSNIVSSTNFGNATYLGLDPNQDKQQLYNSMVQSYRWCDKLTDAATHTHLILNSNHQKRTVWNVFNNQRIRLPKKALSSGHNYTSNHVENALNLFNKNLGLKIEFDNSFGEPVIMKITLDRVLKAVVVLRGFIIEWVNVKGINEDFLDDSDDERLDIWSESKYEVFKKVTDHMNSAMLHFTLPLNPEMALRSFLFWFKSYNTLFDKECKKCGVKLKNYLPPTWRDLRSYDAYHDTCRPLRSH